MVVNGQLFSAMGYELDGTTNQDPILGIIVDQPDLRLGVGGEAVEPELRCRILLRRRRYRFLFHQVRHERLSRRRLRIPATQYSGIHDFRRESIFGLPAATYRQNQFGGSIGGTIIKDKLFFFGDAQLNRQSQGARW